MAEMDSISFQDIATYFGSTSPFISGTPNVESYCENLTQAAKTQDRCGLNSIVFITNRLIEIDETGNLNLPQIFKDIFHDSCAQLSIILVGRGRELTMDLLRWVYGNVTESLFVVENYAYVA